VRGRPVAAPLCIAALAVLGCGKSDAEQVRAAVTDFRTATDERDYGHICKDLLAKDLVRRLHGLGLPCETALAKYLSATRKPKITVKTVKVKGRTARANVRSSAEGQAASDNTLELVQEDGRWRIASLGS
jgi:Putative lumazine-binding